MTKLVWLRVCVPTDNAVTTEEVQSALRAILDGTPVGRVNADADDKDAGGRMHWGAVDVLRDHGRPPEPSAPRRARKVA